MQHLQARLDALEDGVDEDAFAVGDDDDEFEMEDELDMDGKGAGQHLKFEFLLDVFPSRMLCLYCPLSVQHELHDRHVVHVTVAKIWWAQLRPF